MDFVKHILENDKFAQLLGVELVSLDEDHAVAKAPITPDSLNADGVAQGGFVFTLADLSFTFLSNRLHPRTVTQMASATYVAPAEGEWLSAEAREISRTRRNNVVSVVVTNDRGTTVAVFQFNGFIAPLA